MPSSTPVYAIPYPTGGDDLRDGDNAIQALAARVEALLSMQTGNRNVIRNGDMGVAQRGNGPWATQATYGIDGWASTFIGGGNSVSRFATVPVAVPSKYGLNAVVSGQAAAGDLAQVFTRIEGVETLAGRKVTLSFNALANPAGKVGIEITQGFGTSGSATVNTSIGTVTLTTGPLANRYSITFDMPSIAGKTIGTAGDSVTVSFWLSAGSTYAVRGSNIGIQNGTFQFTDVQLEAGDKATPFERLNQQAQLSWCQRYFQRHGGLSAGYHTLGVGHCFSATQAVVVLPLKVMMRATPVLGSPAFTGTMALYSAAGGQINMTSATVSTADENVVALVAVVPSGLVGGGGTSMVTNNTAGWVDLSAEL